MLEHYGLTRDVLDRARRSRDARFDGQFFIAVTTTRIYCRPICPAKTSHDANVRYYATAAEAAAAGFRPCLRCRPEAAPGSPAWLGTSAVVRRALRLIQDGALDQGSIAELATRLGVGTRHLSRLFMRHLGASPVAVAQTRRLHFAKQLLDETDLPITEIALASGFHSVRRFNDAFKSMYHRPPRDMRRRLRAVRPEATDAEIRLRLTYRPPYDWPQLLNFLARRAITGIERVEADRYARTVRTSGGAGVVEVTPAAAADALELCIRGGEPSDLLPLVSQVRRVFDLAADPARIAAVLGRDPLLGECVARHPGMRLSGAWDFFESGVRAIIAERHGELAARAALARLIELAGEPCAEDKVGLVRLFPTAAAVATAELEHLGLTQVRIAALRSFARGVRDGYIRSDTSNSSLLSALQPVPGISPWIAGYIALRGLGDPDAFPSGDPQLRRITARGAAPLNAAALEQRAEGWRPFRGYAVFHLWSMAPDT